MTTKAGRKIEQRYNRNGIPIDAYISLAMLRVMGVEDMFEGLKWDPQFDDVAGGWTGDNRAKS